MTIGSPLLSSPLPAEEAEDAAGAALSPQAVTLAYDFFEAAVEASLPGLSALLVNLRADADALELRLTLEDAQPLDEGWAAQRGTSVAIERQDGTLFETLHVEGTGERA